MEKLFIFMMSAGLVACGGATYSKPIPKQKGFYNPQGWQDKTNSNNTVSFSKTPLSLSNPAGPTGWYTIVIDTAGVQCIGELGNMSSSGFTISRFVAPVDPSCISLAGAYTYSEVGSELTICDSSSTCITYQ